MTVAELREILADLPGDLEITIRAADDDRDEWIVCGVAHVGVEHAHDEDDTLFLAIDGNTDAE